MLKAFPHFLIAFLFAFSVTLLQAQSPPCPNGPEPGEDCESACIACSFNGYQGSSAGWQPGFVPFFCSQVQNDQWFGFIAGSNSATFMVQPSNCTGGNGLQVALFGGCNENFIACNGGGQGNGNVPASITATLTPGTNYYLIIDGYSGDECDFTITVNPPQAIAANPVGPVGSIYGPSTVCPGATVSYQVANVSNAGFYTWTVPPGAMVNNQPSGTTFDAPAGHLVDVTFGATGGPVCVKAANSCADGGMVCKNVQVAPIPPTTLPKVTVCNEDLPYVLPWGMAINVSGNFTNTYTSYLGCDSLVNQQVVVKPPIITDLAPKVICQGACVQVCGENFCTSGQVAKTCTSFQGCDSLVRFQLTVLHPVAEILGGNLLTCAVDSTILHAAATGPNTVKIWKKLDGTVLANNADSLLLHEAGVFVLTVTQQMAGVSCSQSDTIVISANYTVPTAMATVSDSLTCFRPVVQLLGSSNTPAAIYTWHTTANYFYSSEMSPLAYSPGYYVLVVTHPISHCTATALVMVQAEENLPIVVINNDDLDCAHSSTLLYANGSGYEPITYSWEGPNGFTGTAMYFQNVQVPGLYTVTITEGMTGCLAAAATQIHLDTLSPGATAFGGMLDCAGTPVALHGSSPTTGVTFSWSGPEVVAPVPNPLVTLPGLYTLVVTAPNGCTDTASIQVASIQVPVISDVVVNNDQDGQGVGSIHITVSGTTVFTVLWTLNGQYFDDIQNLNNLQAGLYGATVTSMDGCTDTVSITIDNVVPTIEPAAAERWEIMPNPASTFVNVLFRGEAWPEASLTLFDMTGHQVLTASMVNSKAVQLPLKNLPAGQYQLLIRDRGQTVLRPVVIQR